MGTWILHPFGIAEHLIFQNHRHSCTVLTACTLLGKLWFWTLASLQFSHKSLGEVGQMLGDKSWLAVSKVLDGVEVKFFNTRLCLYWPFIDLLTLQKDPIIFKQKKGPAVALRFLLTGTKGPPEARDMINSPESMWVRRKYTYIILKFE